jgi:hypothetical protein
MIAVAGHWEIGYMTPIMEAHFWNLVLRDFGVSKWFMCPVTGIRHNEVNTVDLIEMENFHMILDECKGLPRVFVEPRTRHSNPETTWLHDFTHPADCIYVFGSAHKNPTIGHERDQDKVVSIKTHQDKGVLWSNQCLALILYDRMVKSWQ